MEVSILAAGSARIGVEVVLISVLVLLFVHVNVLVKTAGT